ncbi:MAG: hypothetical protein H7259_06355 [Cytophagales bacterium]|nr:hypothetical protein [Cytophaga sp.]
MLLSKNLKLIHIFRITWRIDLLMLLLCCIAYYVDTKVATEITIPPTLPTLMGTAIAFFVAFNNNQAYDRWWEARIIWGGLVNDSRSWARSLLKYVSVNAENGIDHEQLRNIQERMIRRHIGFLYALKSSLRRDQNEDYKEYILTEELNEISGNANTPEAILYFQSQDLDFLSKAGCIDGFRFMQLDAKINLFCDGMGKSERINNTIFPPTYIFFTRIFIWIFIVLVTMAITELTGAWSILFGWIIGFVFHATHINGLSIINPFEPKPACIPIDSITRTIEINLLQALKEKYIPSPVKDVGGEYIM